MAPSRNKTAGRVLKTPTVSFDSEQESTSQEAVPQPALPFPVVCVGASAGGLEAFTQLLKAVPIDTGMAFVLVSHLSPSHASHLAEILSRATRMPVNEVKDEPKVRPNCVYVIPPDSSMIIAHGSLKLLPRHKVDGRHHPIDLFLESLAHDQKHKSIAVILSGTGSDGTLGMDEITPRRSRRCSRIFSSMLRRSSATRTRSSSSRLASSLASWPSMAPPMRFGCGWWAARPAKKPIRSRSSSRSSWRAKGAPGRCRSLRPI